MYINQRNIPNNILISRGTNCFELIIPSAVKETVSANILFSHFKYYHLGLIDIWSGRERRIERGGVKGEKKRGGGGHKGFYLSSLSI